MGLKVVPISLREANDFVENFHRHSQRTARDGGKFAIGASFENTLVGIGIVGRPISRMLADGFTAEVLRICAIPESPKNTCSFLYGRCWRIWQQMGGLRMITYTLQSESGASLRGAGWQIKGESKGNSKGWQSRPGRKWQPIYGQQKFRWEVHK